MKAETEAFDIAVVGAGSAGCAAALAAAGLGARVALVEPRARVGGAAACGLHRFVCGLFASGGERPGEPLHGEVVARFCRRLAGGLGDRAVRRGRVWLLPFAGGDAFSACASELLAREPRIQVLLREEPRQALCDGGTVQELLLASGRALTAKWFIDCTGQAALCRMAGAPVSWPEKPALAGYGFEVAGIAAGGEGAAPGLSLDVPLALRREVEAGRLPRRFAFTTYEPSEQPGRAWIKLAVPNDAGEGARADADAAFAVLRRLPAFRDARLTATVPEVLPRETCRLRGQYTLTGEDVAAARKFEDGAVRDAWPVERWDPDQGVRYRYLPDGEWCEIPLRCLRPEAGPANLLCAGAALSADSEAAASARAMAVCMATGEAAARACAARL
jgi:hypothetical protein